MDIFEQVAVFGILKFAIYVNSLFVHMEKVELYSLKIKQVYVATRHNGRYHASIIE